MPPLTSPFVVPGGCIIHELSPYPRCPRCGIYLIIGYVAGPFVDELKARFGWKILRYDQGVQRVEADAVVVPCAGHHCARCKNDFDRFPPKKEVVV